MDNQINFTGSFLLLKPNPELINGIYKTVIPKRGQVIPDLIEKGNLFFSAKDCYDRSIIDALRANMINFKYYPKINLKSSLDARNPNSVVEILNKAEVMTDDFKIAKYAETLRYPSTPIDYRWRENDHIEQTFKALGLKKEYFNINNVDHVTIVKDSDGVLRFKISPNNVQGKHYVIKYPKYNDESIELLEINYKSEITDSKDIFDYKSFKEQFEKAVKTDKKKKRTNG